MKRKACTEETGNRVTCIWGLCIEAVGSRFWVYVRTMYCSKAWIRRRGGLGLGRGFRVRFTPGEARKSDGRLGPAKFLRCGCALGVGCKGASVTHTRVAASQLHVARGASG